jgi:hypothetical protein
LPLIFHFFRILSPSLAALFSFTQRQKHTPRSIIIVFIVATRLYLADIILPNNAIQFSLNNTKSILPFSNMTTKQQQQEENLNGVTADSTTLLSAKDDNEESTTRQQPQPQDDNHDNEQNDEEDEYVDSEEDFLLHMEEEAEKQSSLQQADGHHHSQPKSASEAPRLLQDALKKGDIKPDESEEEDNNGAEGTVMEEKKDGDKGDAKSMIDKDVSVDKGQGGIKEEEKSVTEHIHHRVSSTVVQSCVHCPCIVSRFLCCLIASYRI